MYNDIMRVENNVNIKDNFIPVFIILSMFLLSLKSKTLIIWLKEFLILFMLKAPI